MTIHTTAQLYSTPGEPHHARFIRRAADDKEAAPVIRSYHYVTPASERRFKRLSGGKLTAYSMKETDKWTN